MTRGPHGREQQKGQKGRLQNHVDSFILTKDVKQHDPSHLMHSQGLQVIKGEIISRAAHAKRTPTLASDSLMSL